MKIKETFISEVKILKPSVFNDARGFFYETFNISSMKNEGIVFSPVQENCAFSLKAGTIRGIHFQNNPMAQAKIVRCTKGRVLDYAIDLRKGSPTYLKYVFVELSEKNQLQLFIPRGFGHAVISIEDDSMIEYLTDSEYSPELDRSINCFDESIGIIWPIKKHIILSEKDKNAPLLADSDCNFIFKQRR